MEMVTTGIHTLTSQRRLINSDINNPTVDSISSADTSNHFDSDPDAAIHERGVGGDDACGTGQRRRRQHCLADHRHRQLFPADRC